MKEKFKVKTFAWNVQAALRRSIPICAGTLALALPATAWADQVYTVQDGTVAGSTLFANSELHSLDLSGLTLKFADGATVKSDDMFTTYGAAHSDAAGSDNPITLENNKVDLRSGIPVFESGMALGGNRYVTLVGADINVGSGKTVLQNNAVLLGNDSSNGSLANVQTVLGARAYAAPDGASETNTDIATNNNQIDVSGSRVFSQSGIQLYASSIGNNWRLGNLNTILPNQNHHRQANENHVILNGGKFEDDFAVSAAQIDEGFHFNTSLSTSPSQPRTWTMQAEASGNRLEINNGFQAAGDFGADAVEINEILFDADNVTANVNITANTNSINITGGTFKNTDDDGIFGASATVDLGNAAVGQAVMTLNGNQINMSGGKFSGHIESLQAANGLFGQAENSDYRSVQASIQTSNNAINVTGGEIKDIDWMITAVGSVLDKISGSVTANGNIVKIERPAQVDEIKLVTAAAVGTDYVDAAGSLEAQNNVTTLDTQTKVKYGVSGALFMREQNKAQLNVPEFRLHLTNNTVTVGSGVQFDRGSVLAGAAVLDFVTDDDNSIGLGVESTFQPVTGNVDLFSDNKLYLKDYIHSGSTKPKYVGNFQYYNFLLPQAYAVNGSAALQAENVYLDNPNNAAQHAEIQSVAFSGSSRTLQKNDKIRLIAADNLYGTLANKDQTLTISQGVTRSTATTVKQEGKEIYLLVADGSGSGSSGNNNTGSGSNTGSGGTGGSGSNNHSGGNAGSGNNGGFTGGSGSASPTQVVPHTKMFSEGYLGSAVLGLQAADLLAEHGVENARTVAAQDGVHGFAAVSGSHSRYQTGSHVDSNGFSLLAGAAGSLNSAAGDITLGAFFEAGENRYDTHNTFGSEAARGDGKAHYAGAGVLARLDNTGGWWGEAALRAGRMHNRFDSDITDAFSGLAASYSTSMPYFGAQLGAGYAWRAADGVNADFYGQYLYGRQNGRNVTLNTGDEIRFDDVVSRRLRVGTRVLWQAHAQVQPYFGLAFEREFDGKAAAQVGGVAVAEPSLKGNSASVDAGVRFAPSDNWHIQAALTGYTGKRRGVSGSLKAQYRF